jgi:TetR/AcrR family transcriptional regulator, tetracycline repressor protein
MARLTPGIIVTAAVEVINDVGPDQFSVRKLGEALEADPTAIYRHFRSKDELLRAVGDRALAGVTDDLPTSSWQERVRELCVRLRAANLAQPALASLVRAAPPRHGNELLITETMLAALHGAGFAALDAANAYHALIELTIGSAAIDSPMAAMSAAERDFAYNAWRADYAMLDPAEFPTSVSMSTSMYAGTANDRFAFALDAMLDGIERSSRYRR